MKLSYLGSEMEETAQNCLSSIQTSTSHFACSSEVPEWVLLVEQNCPSVLLDEQSKLVRKNHFVADPLWSLFARDGVGAFATLESQHDWSP
jgi:hypothetical protein